jgi:hypothetical protein
VSRIYLASSWRNEHQPEVLSTLRAHGHEVYDFRNPAPGNTGFSWKSIGPEWQEWTPYGYLAALNHPVAREGFALDFGAMKWSDTCVLLLPSGPSAAIEAGWCKGSGRRLIVCALGLREPDLMYAMADAIVLTIGELLHALHTVPQRTATDTWPGLEGRS